MVRASHWISSPSFVIWLVFRLRFLGLVMATGKCSAAAPVGARYDVKGVIFCCRHPVPQPAVELVEMESSSSELLPSRPMLSAQRSVLAAKEGAQLQLSLGSTILCRSAIRRHQSTFPFTQGGHLGSYLRGRLLATATGTPRAAFELTAASLPVDP